MDIQGIRQMGILAATFLVGYVAGELDGVAFLLVFAVIAAGFFYRRRQLAKRSAGLPE